MDSAAIRRVAGGLEGSAHTFHFSEEAGFAFEDGIDD
jgi:hypothetical protein